MNILYGVQLNGNGHITRSLEIIDKLKDLNEVDIVVSGNGSSLDIDSTYKYEGITLYYTKKGSVNWIKTILRCNLFRLIKDIHSIDITKYDLVISDFEPISAWSSILSKKVSIGISNQYTIISRISLSISKLFIKYFAPTNHRISLHYTSDVSRNIFYPIIKDDVVNLQTNVIKGKVVIYLPYLPINGIINRVGNNNKYKFVVYSKKYTESNYKNIIIKEIGRKSFLEDLSDCEGVITNAGFSTTSEVLYLGKKLWSIPIKGQYEQMFNAECLNKMGVYTESFTTSNIEKWSILDPIEYRWENHLDEILQKIKTIYEKS